MYYQIYECRYYFTFYGHYVHLDICSQMFHSSIRYSFMYSYIMYISQKAHQLENTFKKIKNLNIQ